MNLDPWASNLCCGRSSPEDGAFHCVLKAGHAGPCSFWTWVPRVNVTPLPMSRLARCNKPPSPDGYECCQIRGHDGECAYWGWSTPPRGVPDPAYNPIPGDPARKPA